MPVAFQPGMERLILVNKEALPDHTVVDVLGANGYFVTALSTSEALVEEIVREHPGVLVYVLPPAPTQDLAVLRLVRRAAPHLPLVLLAAEGSLVTQREALQLRPVYYGVAPIDEDELLGAVRAALDGPRRRPDAVPTVRRPAGSA